MSVNKDLEIIKQNEPYRRIDFEDYKVGFDSIKWRAVIEAAERMAADITSYEIGYTGKCAEVEELNSELARLKAELEKRRKVVFCKECTRAFCTRITFALKCRIWNVQVSPNAFCSRGQRRESEEGK